jgi:hypothetical protein
MSTVELALKKVKALSESEAERLLGWLEERKTARAGRKHGEAKRNRRASMRRILSWYDSVRGTTDWEPPRMPPDEAKRVLFG